MEKKNKENENGTTLNKYNKQKIIDTIYNLFMC